MQRRTMIGLCTVLVSCSTLLAAASATERSTGELQLQRTVIKTVTASRPPDVITLPTCSTRIAVFTPTLFNCPATAPVCTIEATVTSEVSDVAPGADSIRFYLTVDGAATGVFPTTNFGAHSTAKTRRIESATTVGGGAIAFAGDRILTMRLYRGY